MSEPLVIHVVNAASSRGDLWAEVQRQNALIHELREAVHAHAQTIRDKQAVIDAATERKRSSGLSKQLISSIPITHMSRPQWIQFKDAIERLHGLEEALQEFSRQNCEWGLQAMREKHADLLAQTEPKP